MAEENVFKIEVEDEDNPKEDIPKKKAKPKTAKKTAAKKPAAKKTTAKKTAAKKPAAKKTTAKKTAAKKTPGKSSATTVKKPAKKSAPKKTAKHKIAVLDEDVDEKVEARTNAAKQAPEAESEAEPENSRQEDVLEEIEASEKESTAPLEQPEDDPVRAVISETLAEKRKEEEEELEEEEVKSKRSVRIYKKIVIVFGLFLLLLASAVLYFTFVKATIVLIPNQERISNNLIFDVYDQDSENEEGSNTVKGVVVQKEIEFEGEYPASGTEVVGQEAIGNVVIYNNYTKNQPLVANTRLLTADNKLFRISETVNVPAGGSVTVGIYADQPGPYMAIEPTRFVIPGLWAGLQDKIYAVSKEKVVYQEKVDKYVVQLDLDNANRDLKQQLLAKAKTEVNDAYSDYDEVIYKINEDSITTEIDAEAGDETDAFGARMKAGVIVVAFDESKSVAMAKQKFSSTLPESKEVISFDDSNMLYSMNSYDQVRGVATINSTFEGKISLRENTQIVDKDRIVGLNQSQLDAYLSNLPDVAGYEVSFFPSFIKRVPRLADRIDIQIKK